MKKISLSICIPTYEMGGRGKDLLKKSLGILNTQTYKDFEVVVSDNSKDDEIKNLCAEVGYSALSINYFKSTRIGMAQNTNEAMRHAKGEIIKILYMDDYLADENSLKKIVENFNGYWMVTGCEHDDGIKRYGPHYPTYNKKIYLGKNTIGSPSVLAIKNENPLLFDENMTWLLDCDYYKRMYDAYGEPTILNDINVVIGTGKHQVTNMLSNVTKKKELYYMIKKHKQELLSWLKLW